MKSLKSVNFEVFLAALLLSGILSFGYAGFSLYSRAKNVVRRSEIVEDVYSPEREENIVVS